MTGEVTPEREAFLRLTVHGDNGQMINVAALVDTGFTDFLALSPETTLTLGLPPVTQMEVALGDGSSVIMPVYRASVEWNGHTRSIYVHASDAGTVLGMGLLYGCHLGIDVVDGGIVTVMPLA